MRWESRRSGKGGQPQGRRHGSRGAGAGPVCRGAGRPERPGRSDGAFVRLVDSESGTAAPRAAGRLLLREGRASEEESRGRRRTTADARIHSQGGLVRGTLGALPAGAAAPGPSGRSPRGSPVSHGAARSPRGEAEATRPFVTGLRSHSGSLPVGSVGWSRQKGPRTWTAPDSAEERERVGDSFSHHPFLQGQYTTVAKRFRRGVR